jgi:hypothetical protein
VNRFLPLILVVVALGLHLFHCEWDCRRNVRDVSQAEHKRTIYFRYSPSRSVLLLAKASEDKQEATLYGVLVPGLLVGGACLIAYCQNNPGAASVG